MSRFKRPAPEVSPEALAEPELGRGTAIALVAGFVLLLAGVPLHQAWCELRAGTPVHALDLLRKPPHLSDFRLHDEGNPLRAFEQSLVDASIARKALAPQVQALLSGALGAGSDYVVRGRGDWLFYRPCVDYVSGPAFLTERAQIPPSPTHVDVGPLEAIARLQADCRAAGVRLVLMPTPEKNQLQLAELTGEPLGALPQNADDERFLAAVRALGVELFDPTPQLLPLAREGRAFLHQDTHWTPEAMDAVAAALAARLREQGPYAPQRAWHSRPSPVRRNGDLVFNLRLPADQQLFPPETANVEQVIADDGAPFQSERGAEVLLVGDSFTNIYAQADMGWGESGGLAAHLAMHLGAGVDSIAVNAGGASDARRQLAARPDPLAGKKVLIWQFGARDLAERNWEAIPIHAKPRPAADASGPLVVLAVLQTRPSLPPSSTLYANARVFLKYDVKRVLSGHYQGRSLLVEVPVLRDRKPLASLAYRVGEVQQLTLVEKVPQEWDGQPVVDETGEYDLAPLWGEKVESHSE